MQGIYFGIEQKEKEGKRERRKERKRERNINKLYRKKTSGNKLPLSKRVTIHIYENREK